MTYEENSLIRLLAIGLFLGIAIGFLVRFLQTGSFMQYTNIVWGTAETVETAANGITYTTVVYTVEEPEYRGVYKGKIYTTGYSEGEQVLLMATKDFRRVKEYNAALFGGETEDIEVVAEDTKEAEEVSTETANYPFGISRNIAMFLVVFLISVVTCYCFAKVFRYIKDNCNCMAKATNTILNYNHVKENDRNMLRESIVNIYSLERNCQTKAYKKNIAFILKQMCDKIEWLKKLDSITIASTQDQLDVQSHKLAELCTNLCDWTAKNLSDQYTNDSSVSMEELQRELEKLKAFGELTSLYG